jgi:hypothetical protein
MKDRYTSYRQTPLGIRLVALAENQARYPEYAALSRVGVPAVAALVHELQRDFPGLQDDDFAKQAVGAFVGNVMRANGHEILRRGRVPGDLFTYGALWSEFPVVGSATVPSAVDAA